MALARIRTNIEIKNCLFWTLFDTGARNTYETRNVAKLLDAVQTEGVRRTAQGGEVHEVNQSAILEAKVEGLPVITQTFILDDIGLGEEGKPIEVLIGALSMQQWGIRPVPESENLDMRHYTKECVEYTEV